MKLAHPKKFPAILFCACFGFTLLFLYIHITLTGNNPWLILKNSLFYKPAVNHYPKMTFNSYGVLLTIQCLLVFFTVSTIILHQILSQKPWLQKIQNTCRYIFIIALALNFLVLGLQTLGQANYFKWQLSKFAHNDQNKKIEILSKDLYKYITFVQSTIREKTNAQFITDVDVTNDPGMFAYRQLAYYLYPIEFRFVKSDSEPKYLLYFKKENAAQHIPKGYKILNQYNPHNLVAIKQ